MRAGNLQYGVEKMSYQSDDIIDADRYYEIVLKNGIRSIKFQTIVPGNLLQFRVYRYRR